MLSNMSYCQYSWSFPYNTWILETLPFVVLDSKRTRKNLELPTYLFFGGADVVLLCYGTYIRVQNGTAVEDPGNYHKEPHVHP